MKKKDIMECVIYTILILILICLIVNIWINLTDIIYYNSYLLLYMLVKIVGG